MRTADEALFRFLVELEVAKAQRLQYCVSVLSVTIDPRAAEVEGCNMSGQAERLARGIRSTDVIVARPPSSWSVLLVDAPADTLAPILRRITEPLRSLVRSADSASYPETASSVEDLVNPGRPG